MFSATCLGSERLSPTTKSTEGRRRSFVLLAAVLLFAVALFRLTGPAGSALAQDEKSVVWDRYDVTLELREDGSYHVTERQEIDFRGGPFTGGFADIPLSHTEGIRDVAVGEETASGVRVYTEVPWSDYTEAPGTYTSTTSSSVLSVRYGFTPTSNKVRTFVLEYDVVGALRVYPNTDPPNEQIWWTAISKDVTDVAAVNLATMTITLPQPVSDLTKVVVSGPGGDDPAAHTTDGQTWTWQATDLSSGDDLEVRLQFPAQVDVAAPSWQARDDEARQNQEKRDERDAVLNVIFLGIGLLTLAGGGAGLYGLWYARGRDPHTGVVADFLPKPPDDLPPGAAGTLLDEVANERDVTATLVDLANRGVLKMDEIQGSSVLGFGGGRDFQLTVQQASPNVTPFEGELLKSLFGSTLKEGQTAKLSEVKSRFTEATPRIKELLYQELASRGYFPRSPEATRKSWRRFGTIGLVGILVLGCVAGIAGDLPGFYWFLVGAIAVLAVALLLVSGRMPRKTPAGAEAAAKWRAFRRYLDDIDKYEKVAEAKQIFEKYLPYAVAFGLDESWVAKFASVGAATPGWFGPVIVGNPYGPYPGRGPYGRRGGTVILGPGWGGGTVDGGGHGGGHGGGGVDVDVPDLQDVSDRAGRSLQGSSDSLLDMFNTAAKVFGGFGGGGGGGGWGGGGGGFGGGGSHGGSAGGGSRGFH
jgi:uncharacterized protein (TIGR04222 family)